MYQLAVVGNPIAHSLSPIVFDLFAAQYGIELNYQRILATDAADFNTKVKHFFATGGLALNVTSPFKQDAFSVADLHTSRAGFCRAINFLSLNESREIVADTTDGLGLVNDIELNQHLELAHKNLLIIGSGYVLDSILLDLIAKNPQSIDILARNVDRVVFLGNKFATGVFDSQKNYDIILNSTPNSPDNALFAKILQIKDSTFCYDLTYAKSLFLTTMNKLNPNSRRCNGLGMLVEQARVAFIKLFAKTPDTDATFRGLALLGYHV